MDKDLNLNAGIGLHPISLSPKRDFSKQGEGKLGGILSTIKHQLKGVERDKPFNANKGFNGCHNRREQRESPLTYNQVFGNNEEVESLVINTIIYGALKADKNLERRIQMLDFDNDIITENKRIFLEELSSYISSKLNLRYDLNNKFSSDLSDYLGAKENGFLNINIPSQPFNINLPVLFKLINRGLLTCNELTHNNSGYSKLLFQPFIGGVDSPERICDKALDKKDKVFCLVEYCKTLAQNKNTSPTVIKSLTANSLSQVPTDFSTKLGHRDIWTLIRSQLSPKSMYI